MLCLCMPLLNLEAAKMLALCLEVDLGTHWATKWKFVILTLIASDKLFLSTSVNALSDTESERRSRLLTELVVSTQLAIDYIDYSRFHRYALGKTVSIFCVIFIKLWRTTRSGYWIAWLKLCLKCWWPVLFRTDTVTTVLLK